jgi:SAM-dependent methyltransferase
MSQWERRLTSDSSPARRLEHELRYAVVAPLVRDAVLWVDLGCGTGVAAASALGSRPAASTLLVDVDEDALAQAQAQLPDARALNADLGTAAGTAAVREAIGDTEAVITCFETLAHLEDFVPCVDLLVGLAQRCSVVLGVPNDAFWPVDNPFHRTMWGEGAVDELRRLVPPHVLLEQVPLSASAIVPAGVAELPLKDARVAADRIPSHYLLAFGPATDRLAPLADTRMVDADAQRRVDRERDSELAILAARVAELERAR